jgi:hypothetical protein
MSRFREELRVIPRAAWVVAVCVALGLEVVLWLVAFRQDPVMGSWQFVTKLAFTAFILLFPFAYVLLLGYINGDARRRGMRYVLWTLLAIFIPNSIGVILYFILRDPLPHGCPKCGSAVSSKFTFCPNCGSAMAQICPGCRGAVEPGWSHCARCGAGLRAA